MDHGLKYFKCKLIKITYIDYHNKKLSGFIFSNSYIKKGDRLETAQKYLDKNIKKIVSFEKVNGFIPIDVKYINNCDIDYHI